MYSTTIPIQSYGVNDKISVEIEMVPQNDVEGFLFNQTDELEKSIREHKSKVDAIVAKLYPNRYEGDSEYKLPLETGVVSKQEQEDLMYKQLEKYGSIEDVIKQCTSLKELSMYDKIIDRKPEGEEKRKLWITYDEMFNKLKPKQDENKSDSISK